MGVSACSDAKKGECACLCLCVFKGRTEREPGFAFALVCVLFAADMCLCVKGL